MINHWTTKNTDPKGETKHCRENIKSFYDKLYDKSDKAKNKDFWEEITITTSGQKLKAERKF
jgi:hypothetical protein